MEFGVVPESCNFQALPERVFKMKSGKIRDGGMGEWLKPAVLKTVSGVTRSGVRIPLPPPLQVIDLRYLATFSNGGWFVIQFAAYTIFMCGTGSIVATPRRPTKTQNGCRRDWSLYAGAVLRSASGPTPPTTNNGGRPFAVLIT